MGNAHKKGKHGTSLPTPPKQLPSSPQATHSNHKPPFPVDQPNTSNEALSETHISALLKIQRGARRAQAKKQAVDEQHWKLFAELDTKSEGEILNLARFFQTLLDCVPVPETPDGNPGQNQKNILREVNSKRCLDEAADDDTATTILLDNIHIDDTNTLIRGDVMKYNIGKAPITVSIVKEIIEVYRQGGRLSVQSVMKILRAAYRILKEHASVMHVDISHKEKVTVIGDLHGNLVDLLHILDESGLPSASNKYIFNGDFVDRGENSVEVVCILFACLIAEPGGVILNRGNHEDVNICSVYGFQEEAMRKYPDPLVFGMFVEVFNYLPLVTLLNDRTMILHGGLFKTPGVTIDDLARIDRLDYMPVADPKQIAANIPISDEKIDKEYLRILHREILWSDPISSPGLTPSSRGVGVHFGPDIAEAFMTNNGIDMIIRAHECARNGFDLPFVVHSSCNRRPVVDSPPLGDLTEDQAKLPLLCTLFSASNYGGGDNYGAYLVIMPHAGHNSSPIRETGLHFTVHRYLNNSRQSIHQHNIVSTNQLSLIELIKAKYGALQIAFSACDETAAGTVTRNEWAEIMQRVTNIRIRWLSIVNSIVPADCLSPKSVDYISFLKYFKKDGSGGLVAGPTAAGGGSMQSMYGPVKKQLEAIFSWFDVNNDGFISRTEFREKCGILNAKMKDDQFKLTDIDHIMDLMDFDKSDSIDLNEFFEVFRLLDAADGSIDGVLSLATRDDVVEPK